jgi:hypothetical protein
MPSMGNQNTPDREYLKGTLFEKMMTSAKPFPELKQFDQTMIQQLNYSQMVTDLIKQFGGRQAIKRHLERQETTYPKF